MKILYTGATKQGEEQLNPDVSLGGLVSGTSIPNDVLSNIFSVASLLSIQNKRREIKMIALHNDDGDVLTDIKFAFSLDTDSICNYKIAIVSPTISDDCSCFEVLSSSGALPYYATFIPIADGQEVIIPGELASEAYLGIWLMREYNYTADDLKKKSCAEWLTKLEAVDADPEAGELNIKENFAFSLSYEIGESSVSGSTSGSSSAS